MSSKPEEPIDIRKVRQEYYGRPSILNVNAPFDTAKEFVERHCRVNRR
jgi:hypothetical protein